MADDDILSQDEVDALLTGMGGDEIETDVEPENDAGARSYNFDSEDRIIRGRMPTLEMVNERFGRYFRISLLNMLRRSAEISISSIQVMKFSEYIHTLFVPTSLNIIKMNPLRGSALMVFEPKLVFTVLDNYFGGEGRFQARIEGREFTETELNVVKMVLELCFKDLTEAWAPVMDLEFEFINHEVNPQFANIVSPSEVVVISTFHVELDGGGGGDIQMTLPYSMIEPIRELLGAGIQSDSASDDGRWETSMKEEILLADVSLSAEFTQLKMSLKKILNLKAGDILPIDMPKSVVAKAEGTAMFNASFGEHGGKKSLKINERVVHPKDNTPQFILNKNN